MLILLLIARLAESIDQFLLTGILGVYGLHINRLKAFTFDSATLECKLFTAGPAQGASIVDTPGTFLYVNT